MRHFNEEIAPCNNRCDVRLSAKTGMSFDRTAKAKDIIACYNEIRSTCDKVTHQLMQLTLLGSVANEIKSKKLNEVEHYGAAKKFTNCPANEHKFLSQKIIYLLIAKKVLVEKLTS